MENNEIDQQRNLIVQVTNLLNNEFSLNCIPAFLEDKVSEILIKINELIDNLVNDSYFEDERKEHDFTHMIKSFFPILINKLSNSTLELVSNTIIRNECYILVNKLLSFLTVKSNSVKSIKELVIKELLNPNKQINLINKAALPNNPKAHVSSYIRNFTKYFYSAFNISYYDYLSTLGINDNVLFYCEDLAYDSEFGIWVYAEIINVHNDTLTIQVNLIDRSRQYDIVLDHNIDHCLVLPYEAIPFVKVEFNRRLYISSDDLVYYIEKKNDQYKLDKYTVLKKNEVNNTITLLINAKLTSISIFNSNLLCTTTIKSINNIVELLIPYSISYLNSTMKLSFIPNYSQCPNISLNHINRLNQLDLSKLDNDSLIEILFINKDNLHLDYLESMKSFLIDNISEYQHKVNQILIKILNQSELNSFQNKINQETLIKHLSSNNLHEKTLALKALKDLLKTEILHKNTKIKEFLDKNDIINIILRQEFSYDFENNKVDQDFLILKVSPIFGDLIRLNFIILMDINLCQSNILILIKENLYLISNDSKTYILNMIVVQWDHVRLMCLVEESKLVASLFFEFNKYGENDLINKMIIDSFTLSILSSDNNEVIGLKDTLVNDLSSVLSSYEGKSYITDTMNVLLNEYTICITDGIKILYLIEAIINITKYSCLMNAVVSSNIKRDIIILISDSSFFLKFTQFQEFTENKLFLSKSLVILDFYYDLIFHSSYYSQVIVDDTTLLKMYDLSMEYILLEQIISKQELVITLLQLHTKLVNYTKKSYLNKDFIKLLDKHFNKKLELFNKNKIISEILLLISHDSSKEEIIFILNILLLIENNYSIRSFCESLRIQNINENNRYNIIYTIIEFLFNTMKITNSEIVLANSLLLIKALIEESEIMGSCKLKPLYSLVHNTYIKVSIKDKVNSKLHNIQIPSNTSVYELKLLINTFTSIPIDNMEIKEKDNSTYELFIDRFNGSLIFDVLTPKGKQELSINLEVNKKYISNMNDFEITIFKIDDNGILQLSSEFKSLVKLIFNKFNSNGWTIDDLCSFIQLSTNCPYKISPCDSRVTSIMKDYSIINENEERIIEEEGLLKFYLECGYSKQKVIKENLINLDYRKLIGITNINPTAMSYSFSLQDRVNTQYHLLPRYYIVNATDKDFYYILLQLLNSQNLKIKELSMKLLLDLSVNEEILSKISNNPSVIYDLIKNDNIVFSYVMSFYIFSLFKSELNNDNYQLQVQELLYSNDSIIIKLIKDLLSKLNNGLHQNEQKLFIVYLDQLLSFLYFNSTNELFLLEPTLTELLYI